MTESAELPEGQGDDAAPVQPVPGATSPTAPRRRNGSDEESAAAVSPAKPSRPWPVLTLLGGFALGLPVNALSDAYPGAFLSAVAVVLLLVVSAAYQLRRLPHRAPIHTLLPRIALPVAAAAAVGSLFLTGSAASWAVLLAAAFGVTGCLRPGPADGLFEQLQAVATTAFGVALIGYAVSSMLEAQVLVRGATIVFGVAVIGLGVVYFLGSRVLVGAATIVVGVPPIAGGLGLLLDSQVFAGATTIATGVALIACGLSFLLTSEVLVGASAIAGGVALTGFGVVLLLDSQVLVGAATTALGVALIANGVVLLLGSRVLVGAATTALGVALIAIGVVLLLGSRVLAGAATTALGVTLIGLGVGVDGGRVAGWFRSLLAAPADEPGPDLHQEHEGQRRTAGPEPGPPPA